MNLSYHSRFTCRICGNAKDNRSYHVREMLYGTREVYEYFQCSACGCLQIVTPPEDISRYYANQYFAFREVKITQQMRLRAWFDRHRVRHYLQGDDLVGMVINRVAKPLDYAVWMQNASLTPQARVLDVGCGTGKLLTIMKLGGIWNCMGIDPHIQQSILYPNGLMVLKQSLEQTSGHFDFIMFHHSFEHMANPKDTLRHAARLLSAKGSILIRIPLADSEAWEEYRENWWSIDAPRHYYLHTQESMRILSEQTNLEIYGSFRDATPSQFINSELYRRDIPISAKANPRRVLGSAKILEYKRRTKHLNRIGRGDMGGFFLRHKPRAG